MMQVKYYTEPCEHIIINNVYTDKELALIWKELDFIGTDKLLDPKSTGSAFAKETNTFLKKAKGIFLDDFYGFRENSYILTSNRKLWSKEVLACCSKLSGWWTRFINSNKDYTLINYYENEDYYGFHTDDSLFTAITVLYKSPLNYIGGDVVLKNNREKIIPLSNNSALIFPSHIYHAVQTIKIVDSSINNSGRYSIVQFCSYNS